MYLPSDIVSNQLINYEILRRRWGREEEVDDVYGEPSMVFDKKEKEKILERGDECHRGNSLKELVLNEAGTLAPLLEDRRY